MQAPSPARAAGPQRGFTLIELMVTIGIAAVLAAVAAPSFQGLVANSRLKSHNNAIQTSLTMARSEAIKRKARVVVCKSADRASCSTSGDWQQGWIVFVDTNDSATVDAGEAILEKVAPLSGAFVLKGDGNLTEYISYTSSGAAKVKASDTFQTGTLTLCQTAGGNARLIELFATGRLSFSKATISSCTAS